MTANGERREDSANERRIHRDIRTRVFGRSGTRARQTYRIGRLSPCEIVLKGGMISRKHAMLQSTETGEFSVIDLGSRNGTFHNGTRISAPASVKDGDEICVGEHHLIFRGPARPAASDDESSTGTQVMFVRRIVSVLVADVRAYTTMARLTEPESLAKAMGSWFREAGRILQQHGCWSVKYIGDAVMAVWLHGESAQDGEILRILEGAAELIESTLSVRDEFRLPLPFEVEWGSTRGWQSSGTRGRARIATTLPWATP